METAERERDVPCAELRVLAERVHNLEGWQRTQNGHLAAMSKSIDAVRDSISGIYKAALGFAVTAGLALLVYVLQSLRTP